MQAHKTLDMFLTASMLAIGNSHLYINCSFFITSAKYLAADSRISWQKCATVSLVFIQLYLRHKINFQHTFQPASRRHFGLIEQDTRRRKDIQWSLCLPSVPPQVSMKMPKGVLHLSLQQVWHNASWYSQAMCKFSSRYTLYHLFSEESCAVFLGIMKTWLLVFQIQISTT